MDTGVRLYLPSEDVEDSRATQYKYTNLNDFIWLSFIPITGIGYLATILFNDDAKRLWLTASTLFVCIPKHKKWKMAILWGWKIFCLSWSALSQNERRGGILRRGISKEKNERIVTRVRFQKRKMQIEKSNFEPDSAFDHNYYCKN